MKCFRCDSEFSEDDIGGKFMLEPVCKECGEVLELAQDRMLAGEYGPNCMELLVLRDSDNVKKKQEAVKRMSWDKAKKLMDETIAKVPRR